MNLQKRSKFELTYCRNGWEVQYSEDQNEVCIIPHFGIDTSDFSMLLKYFQEKGYRYWVPPDERCGYRFVKKRPPREKEKGS